MNLSVNNKDKKDLYNNNLNEENKNENNINNSQSLTLTLSNISLANPQISYIDEEEGIKNKKFGHFILGEKLGQGTFGFVRKATHTLTGEIVAIKILDKEKILKEKDKFRLKNEIKILKKLRHKNIVHLYGIIDTKISINLIMEYCEGEELFDYINRKQKLKEMEACQIFQQIISGVEYLSKNKITHRDLKPENIIVNKDNLNIKIVDFGLSNIYKDDELLQSKCGSLCFAAPEMISGKKYNGLNADIWSSGVILFSMICGFLPFQEEDSQLLYQKIVKGKYQIPYYVSQLAGDLIHKILNINPNKRYTIEQIKKHKWFKMIDINNNITEGLLLDKYVIPFDDDIIGIMVKEYNCKEDEIKNDVIKNRHNLITTTYYLLLNKKIKEGKKSICNIGSEEFIQYLNDKNNLLENYEYNLDKVCKERININYKYNNQIKEEENKNNNNENNKKDIFKEEMESKLIKLHKEIDDIKNKIYSNNTYNYENEQNNNKIKNVKLRKMILNEINSKKIVFNGFKSIENEENENGNNIKENINKNKRNYQEISAIIYPKKNNKEISVEKENNLTISFKTYSKKKNMFKLVKNKNKNQIKKVNLKINVNNCKLNSKKKLTKNNNNIMNCENNLKNNPSNEKKNISCYINNNFSFSERKNCILLTKKNENKMTYKPKTRKDSCDLLLSEKNKNRHTSSKKIFNSKLVTKNKNINYLHNKYNLESNKTINNNNISMTIYENESEKIKSILPTKNKNLSQILSEDKKSVQKKEKKLKPLIKTKSKTKIKETSIKKKNYKISENNGEQSKIKKTIKPSISHRNSVRINKNNTESKKRTFVFSLRNNNDVLKKIKKINIDKPLLNKKINNNSNNNKIKNKFIPFDLNSIIFVDKNNNINDFIGEILYKENINYIIQKNKFICWKNELIFELIFSSILENVNLYKINIINKSGHSIIFKNIINDIINSLIKGFKS